MNITVNSQLLASELRLLSKIVPTKPAIHVLSHVLFEAGDNGLESYATDLELSLSSRCDAEVHAPGRIAVPAQRLLSMVEQFVDDDVTLAQDAKGVSIKCGAFASRLQALPADDFPQQPLVEGTSCILDSTDLRDLIARTRYVVNASDSKAVLRGALLTLDGAVGIMAATDGKQLALATINREGPSMSVVVPVKALDALVVQPDDGEVATTLGPRHLFFQAGDRVLTSRVIDGKFPAYERIIPRTNPHKASIGRSQLAAALRRVRLVSEETLAVNFTFNGGSLKLTASSAEVGAAEEAVAMEYEGPPIRITANGNYVLNFLNASRRDTIDVMLKDGKSHVLLMDGADHLGVITLMK